MKIKSIFDYFSMTLFELSSFSRIENKKNES